MKFARALGKGCQSREQSTCDCVRGAVSADRGEGKEQTSPEGVGLDLGGREPALPGQVTGVGSLQSGLHSIVFIHSS